MDADTNSNCSLSDWFGDLDESEITNLLIIESDANDFENLSNSTIVYNLRNHIGNYFSNNSNKRYITVVNITMLVVKTVIWCATKLQISKKILVLKLKK